MDKSILKLIDQCRSVVNEKGFNSLENYHHILKDIDFVAIESDIVYNKSCYHKIKLYQEQQFEIVLICWLEDQETAFHQHPAQGCLMKVLKGRVIEERKSEDNTITETIVPKDTITFIDSQSVHKILSPQHKAVTLHIYSPSGYYDED